LAALKATQDDDVNAVPKVTREIQKYPVALADLQVIVFVLPFALLISLDHDFPLKVGVRIIHVCVL